MGTLVFCQVQVRAFNRLYYLSAKMGGTGDTQITDLTTAMRSCLLVRVEL